MAQPPPAHRAPGRLGAQGRLDRPSSTAPPLLAWTLIICSAALVGSAALAALLIVDPRSTAGGALIVAVIGAGLLTMMLCAVAAARVQDAYQRPDRHPARPSSPVDPAPFPDVAEWSDAPPPVGPPLKAAPRAQWRRVRPTGRG